MRKIVYYVAMTLDGYICGPDENIEGYIGQGSGLDQYLSDLKKYDTVIMGRKTYEFGFKFGIIPGALAYEHMDHYIFSNTAVYPDSHEKLKIVKPEVHIIEDLKNGDGTDIYLCGGGIFAGWLLENKLIDDVIVKLSPKIYGDGKRLFGESKTEVKLKLLDHSTHDFGLIFLSYKVLY